MIKTINDLRKCYAVRADKEVFELFMDKCEEFGITWGDEEPRAIKYGGAVVFDGAYMDNLGHGGVSFMEQAGYKRLTLSDFKPTRTEYVQVTESIFDLRDEFERGELYKPMNDDSYEKITCESKLGELYGYRLIYRRVEKVVDWTTDVMDFLGSELQRGERVKHADVELFCDGSKFINLNASLPKDRFLELCRVALRANGEIE